MISFVKNIQDANCITHSGTMHADDVFATAFLELYFGDVKLFRTTSVNFDEVDSNALVYDVGRRKFDHHQVDALKRENGITYCSFGLLWKEFGKDFLKKRNIEYIDEVFEGIDKDLIEGIDADDNGIFPKIEADYKVKTTSSIVKLFNPSFNSDEDESEQFLKAEALAKMIFEEEILYINGKVIAAKKVECLLKNRNKEKKYLVLDEFLPYEETLLNVEDANNILFVAYPSNRGGYAIKTVPKSLEDRTARMDFPEEWAGLCNEELENVSKINGLKFCHLGRFIVSCANKEVVYKVLDYMCK
ncbi:MAG: MYG1 family protein [Bacilli bacterium]|nr:MYG1 family protein [Bacilli bacterium]